jgi:hypothetical protein
MAKPPPSQRANYHMVASVDEETGAVYFLVNVRAASAETGPIPSFAALRKARLAEGWVHAEDGSMWQIAGRKWVDSMLGDLGAAMGRRGWRRSEAEGAEVGAAVRKGPPPSVHRRCE